MVLNNEQRDVLFGYVPRTGLINGRYRWANGTVPYELMDVFSTAQRAYILKGLAELEEVTCLKFVPRNINHEDYVQVIVS